MSNPVTVQANKVWQLLTAPSTASTYKQTLDLTWIILKETAQLLWLVVCLVLVAGDWFWKKSIAVGRETRVWVDHFGTTASPASDPGVKAAQLWQNLLVSIQSAASTLLVQARQQLDLPPAASASAVPATPPASAAETPKTTIEN